MWNWKKILVLFGGISLVLFGGWIAWKMYFSPIIPDASCGNMQGLFRFWEITVEQDTNGIFRTMDSYPGCEEKDIFIWWCKNGKIEGQIWAGCNVWATISSRNAEDVSSLERNPTQLSTIVWEYFAWGRNRPFSLAGKSWENPETLLSTISTWIGFIPERTSNWSTDWTWPCHRWYHIPSQAEWENAMLYTKDALVSVLALPAGGFLGNSGSVYNLSEWYYWSTTPATLGANPFDMNSKPDTTSSAYGFHFFDDGNSVFTRTPDKKEGRFLIRCIKNNQ